MARNKRHTHPGSGPKYSACSRRATPTSQTSSQGRHPHGPYHPAQSRWTTWFREAHFQPRFQATGTIAEYAPMTSGSPCAASSAIHERKSARSSMAPSAVRPGRPSLPGHLWHCAETPPIAHRGEAASAKSEISRGPATSRCTTGPRRSRLMDHANIVVRSMSLRLFRMLVGLFRCGR